MHNLLSDSVLLGLFALHHTYSLYTATLVLGVSKGASGVRASDALTGSRLQVRLAVEVNTGTGPVKGCCSQDL